MGPSGPEWFGAHRSVRRVVLPVLVALAGCTGNAELIPERALPQLVLRQADLPPGFVRFDWGPMSQRDLEPGPREDPNRFGRQGGWKARYRRTEPQGGAGPLVVESRADVFGSEEGAEQDLAAYRTQFQQAPPGGSAGRLPITPIGDEAVAVTFVQSGVRPVRYITVAWRLDNVTASILVSGFDGELAVADALALARKQHARLTRASAM
jgi:hypothetical protein